MPLYMYQATYTSESVTHLIKEPQDRIEMAREFFEELGAKIVVWGYPIGEYDVLVVYNAPDDTTAASLALAIAAGGVTKSAKTTKLLTGNEWIASLRMAQRSGYKPVQSSPARRRMLSGRKRRRPKT